MTDTIRNLDDIATRYTVFEQDQVLTPAQLNSVSEYLGDQERLTRVGLLGVGIACGLWAGLDGNEVVLGHGVGATTDGDLVFLDEPTRYDRYKPYDRSAPVYPPFMRNDKMILAYELVRKGESDSRALVLSGFKAREGLELGSMAAVLYVESYLRDDDLCTGTDCDNRGKESMHTLRLLLVERESAAALAAALATPDRAARTPLDPVVIARAVLRGTLAAEADLAAVYRQACAKIHGELVRALGALWGPCKPFLEDLADADPGPRWRKALETIRDAARDRGIQYYYDFLKDVAETYNAFRDALFGDTAVCCPDPAAFPKHLVLGALDPKQRSARERTGFYPSPMVSAAFEQRARARFLIAKLDTLITKFAPPVPAAELRITPSAFEDRPLEQRAIPFYYEPVATHTAWSYTLSRRDLQRYNYSYNADRYGAQGAAAKPLEAQIGAFDFFRIEGHIGRPLGAVREQLDPLIRQANLPIDVEYLRLDKPPKGWRPPWRGADLVPFHELLKAELLTQLDEADQYGDLFVTQVKSAVAAQRISDADNNGVPLGKTADDKKLLMSRPAKSAAKKIGGETYDPTWKDDYQDVTAGAAEFQEAFTLVSKKDFASPLDSVIAGQPARWLNWFDIMIDDAGQKDAERAQLSAFLQQHPGLEHYAGVLRGGTFVVVCDAADLVVADFMLPYNCCEPRVAPPKPVPLPKPPRPTIVWEKPIRFVPYIDKTRFEKLRLDIFDQVQKDYELNKKYFEGLKDTVDIFAGAKAGGGTTFPGGTVTAPGGGFTDPALDLYARDTAWKTRRVELIHLQLLDPELDPEKRTGLDKQLQKAEIELAASVGDMTEYVAARKMDVKKGTEGSRALTFAADSLKNVGAIDALTLVEKQLNAVRVKAGTLPDAQIMIDNMLAGRMH